MLISFYFEDNSSLKSSDVNSTVSPVKALTTSSPFSAKIDSIFLNKICVQVSKLA